MLRHGILRSDQKVVQEPGSGIDTRRFQASSVPDGAPVFLLIARLLRDKGFFEYVEAARLVRRNRPQTRFQLPDPPDPHTAGTDGTSRVEGHRVYVRVDLGGFR